MPVSSLGYLPPAFLVYFIMDATGGCPGGVWYSPFLHVTARPATEAPVTALYLRGRRCTAAPNALNRPTPHVPQPLLHWVRRLRASLALCGVANGAGPWRCTAGVTLASTRTRDRWTEARTGPGPLCPRNGRRAHTIQGTCDDTASGGSPTRG